jgi:aryl-alcohol dehydrogenase-like predicted oxidoreductase
MVWSPLAKGMLTGRIRKGQQTDLHRATMLTSFSDERRLDASNSSFRSPKRRACRWRTWRWRSRSLIPV